MDTPEVGAIVAAGVSLGSLTDANATAFRGWIAEGSTIAMTYVYASPVLEALKAGNATGARAPADVE